VTTVTAIVVIITIIAMAMIIMRLLNLPSNYIQQIQKSSDYILYEVSLTTCKLNYNCSQLSLTV
jgi:hypothetical protein